MQKELSGLGLAKHFPSDCWPEVAWICLLWSRLGTCASLRCLF